MADLPRYTAGNAGGGGTPQVSENVPYQGTNALAALGDTLSGIAQTGTQVYMKKKKDLEEKQDKFDRQQAIRVFSEYQMADQERQQTFRNSYAGDTSKFAESELEDQDKFYQKFASEPITPGAQEHLNTMYNQHRVQSSAEALSFQAQARGAEVKQNVEVGSRNLINDTRNNPYTNYWANQGKLDELIASLEGSIPHAQLTEYKNQLSDENAISMIRGKADGNPRQTLEEIQNGVYDKFLTPNGMEVVRTGLQRQIEAEDKQLQAQRKADVTGALDSHFSSILATNTPVLTLAQVEATGDPDLVQQYTVLDKAARQGYKILKGSEGKPLDEQLALLDVLKPKPGSKTFAEEEKIHDMLQEAVVNQNKAYQEDKVQASIENNQQVAQAYNLGQAQGIRATLTYQLGKGTPGNQLQVASQAEVIDHADKLNGLIENAQYEEAKNYMASLKDDYDVATLPDGRSSWDVFKAQLQNAKGHKVPDDFIMALQYSDIKEGGEIFRAYQTKVDEYKKLIGEEPYKAVEDAVTTQFSSYANMMQKIPGFASSGQLANEKFLLTKYTARLVQQGVKPGDAAKQAYKTMYPYDIIKDRRSRLVIPDNVGAIKINSSVIQQKTGELVHPDRLFSFMSQGVGSSGYATGEIVPLSFKDNTGGGRLSLRYDAAQSLENINSILKKNLGTGIKVNSAHRTKGEQAALYNGGSGRYPAAAPGTSKHEVGLAIDVENWKIAKPYLLANGWVQPNPKNDPIHFEYQGKGYGQNKLPPRLANEADRRQYANNLSKNGVWISSSDLRSVTLYSPNADGSLTPIYNGYKKPYSFPLVELQKGKLPSAGLIANPPKKTKQYLTQGKVSEIAGKSNRAAASKLSGKKVVSDKEAQFILERGF